MTVDVSGRETTVEGPSPSWWERLLAAAPHALTLFSLIGTLGAVIIWLAARHRVPYVERHARRAVFLQIAAHVVVVLALLALVVIASLSAGSSFNAESARSSGTLGGFIGSLAGAVFVLMGAAIFFVVSAIVGAIRALGGHAPGHIAIRVPSRAAR